MGRTTEAPVDICRVGGFGVLADDVAVHAFLTLPWPPSRLVHVR